MFEVKELTEGQPNTHRELFIKSLDGSVDPANRSRFIPNLTDRWIAQAIEQSRDQLKCAEKERCPGILVIYSNIRAIQTVLEIDNTIFTDAMYRLSEKKKVDLSSENYSHISAVAYLSVKSIRLDVVMFRCRFYHNKFAKIKMPDPSPFIDRKCQHYDLNEDLSKWIPRLDHKEDFTV